MRIRAYSQAVDRQSCRLPSLPTLVGQYVRQAALTIPAPIDVAASMIAGPV